MRITGFFQTAFQAVIDLAYKQTAFVSTLFIGVVIFALFRVFSIFARKGTNNCCAGHSMTEEKYIRDLPDAVKKELAFILDNQRPNWKSLMETIGYGASSITQVGMATLSPGGSPTIALLSLLAQDGRTVRELMSWLLALPRRSPALQALVNDLRAPVITQNTPREVSVLQGQDVWIQCEASGSQPLHFQWFKKREELCGKTEKTLILQNVCQEDQGHYVCRVANRFGFCVFTDWTRVSVSGEQAEALQCFGKIGTVKDLHY